MNSELVYKLSKYFIVFVVLCLFFKFIPSHPMTNRDITLTTAIVVLLYVVFENAYGLYSDDGSLSPAECSVKCALDGAEHLVVTGATPTSTNVSAVQANIDELNQRLKALEASRADVVVDPNMATKNGVSFTNPDGTVRLANGEFIYQPLVDKQAIAIGSRANDGVMASENYGYRDFNSLPTPTNSGSFPNYSMLPPDKWYPIPPHPPICVSNDVKQCPVCPIIINGDNNGNANNNLNMLELMHWDSSRRISPGDEINTDFIEQKLNSGR